MSRLFGIFLTVSAVLQAVEPSAVRMWEEDTVLPTYLAGEPEPNR